MSESTLRCPHSPACPACPLLDAPYGDQLAAKERRLAGALARYPSLATLRPEPCVGCAPGERSGYRRRVKWVVDGARIGLYGPGHEVLDSPDCRAAPPAALLLAQRLRVRPGASDDRLVALDLRVNDRAELLATLVFGTEQRAEARREAERLAQWLWPQAQRLGLLGLATSWRPPRSAATLGQAPEPLRGDFDLEDRLGELRLFFPAGGFCQVHSGTTARIQRALRELRDQLAPRPAAVLDLYAGVGTLGLALADEDARLILVEAFGPAMEAARKSCARWPAAHRPRLLSASAAEALRSLGGDPPRPLLVVLDPPRSGLDAATLEGVAALRPELLCYLSCDPHSLARDLAALASLGLSCRGLRPYDMMPGTEQVETLAWLVPARRPRCPAVGELGGTTVLAKPPFVRAPSLDRAAAPLEPELSGLQWAGPGPGSHEESWLALVRGVAHKGGRLRVSDTVTLRFRRRAVAGGHSLLHLQGPHCESAALRSRLAEQGQPILGDAAWGDPGSNRFFWARHGLQRPFLHRAGLWLGPTEGLEVELPPDLLAVMDSLLGRAELPPADPDEG